MSLALESTPDLIDELLARYDNAVFCGHKIMTKTDTDVLDRHYEGNYIACLGLCELVKDTIQGDMQEEECEKA